MASIKLVLFIFHRHVFAIAIIIAIHRPQRPDSAMIFAIGGMSQVRICRCEFWHFVFCSPTGIGVILLVVAPSVMGRSHLITAGTFAWIGAVGRRARHYFVAYFKPEVNTGPLCTVGFFTKVCWIERLKYGFKKLTKIQLNFDEYHASNLGLKKFPLCWLCTLLVSTVGKKIDYRSAHLDALDVAAGSVDGGVCVWLSEAVFYL